jgi:hypothetical protein
MLFTLSSYCAGLIQQQVTSATEYPLNTEQLQQQWKGATGFFIMTLIFFRVIHKIPVRLLHSHRKKNAKASCAEWLLPCDEYLD